MISFPKNNPAVSFEQTISNTAEVAKSQIAKASTAESSARISMENANFRLIKATEMLQSSEVAYRQSITKSAWNREELRKTYNEAIARFRDAEVKADEANAEFTKASNSLDSLRTLSRGEVVKREFSDDKRQNLASKGKAMPDGSFPIETKGDLSNAVQSIGRAKDYDATKKHIITQAKSLGAEDMLPEEWQNEKSLATSVPMKKAMALLIVCPKCDGSGCANCDQTGKVEDDSSDMDDSSATDDSSANAFTMKSLLGYEVAKASPAVGSSSMDDSSELEDGSEDSSEIDDSSEFTTKALLRRDFEKSASYQRIFVAKGDTPGHPFHGNQYTEGSMSDTATKLAKYVADNRGNLSPSDAHDVADSHAQHADVHRSIADALRTTATGVALGGMGNTKLASAMLKEAALHDKAAALHDKAVDTVLKNQGEYGGKLGEGEKVPTSSQVSASSSKAAEATVAASGARTSDILGGQIPNLQLPLGAR